MKFIYNNHIKRALAIFCVFVLIFSFVGCKKANSTSSDSVASASTLTSTGTISAQSSNESTTSVSDTNKKPSSTQNNSSTNTPANSSSESSQENIPVSSSNTTVTEEVPEKQWYTRNISLSAQELNTALTQQYIKPKNVIVMIGDGMGANDLEITRQLSDAIMDFGIIIDKLPNKGFATTRNYKGEVTDSAASATALATGTKTLNSMVGLDSNGQFLQNVSELARAQSKKVGIVTSDLFTGATPSGFTVHTSSRGNTDEIVKGFLEFLPDVLIGDGMGDFNNVTYASQKYLTIREKIAVASSFNIFENKINELPDKPFFGFASFNLDSNTTQLAYCTEIALNKLDNKNGFFLMVESCGPDKGGHTGNLNQKLTGVNSLNNAVAVALKYCLKNPDTVLIVTADHETGGVVIPENLTKDSEIFTALGHTAIDVGVFALGYGTEYFNGKTVDNTDIAKFVINTLKN